MFQMKLKTESGDSQAELKIPRCAAPDHVQHAEGKVYPNWLGHIVGLAKVYVSKRLVQFIKFCFVGGSGLGVDMAVLALLADPRFLGWNIILSKICAAETALVSNFIWNELWTFRQSSSLVRAREQGVLSASLFHSRSRAALFRRFAVFNGICGIGIALAVTFLHVFHHWLGWNLYLSNLVAILLVTCWNFGMNARFNWRLARA